ncbi:MAG: cytochrome c peroxidase [Saprospiraceae bacterium]|nr:cytochrome-c peroxidase [Saprospiraceae bacterium]MCB9312189.1 cytochrome-c peroxidase [Lewinellaceae bacterium]
MKNIYLILIAPMLAIISCKPDPVEPAVYDPTPYTLDIGDFPDPVLPMDNPLTVSGVELGRMLFYEKDLSRDRSQSCADCHIQGDAFSDIRRFSVGVEGLDGKRQAMPVMNVAWHYNGMFWDGRAPRVRDQALKPIQDPLEMNETLPGAIAKLEANQRYRDQFIRAFGDDEITSERMGLAMEQFMFTMVSKDSKYDKWLKGEVTLTPEEENGRKLFFAEFDPNGVGRGAECFHCHAGHNFTNDEFMNNGLDTDAEFTDTGREMVTMSAFDRAKFKVPSLRNIAKTPPYMHDGRFATLEEVLDHYNTGAKNSSTVEFLMQYNIQPGGLGLTAQEKSDIIAFMHTLTDDTFLTNPAYSDPN